MAVDSYPTVEELKAMGSPESRASVLADAGMWAQTFVAEAAKSARMFDRLLRKLQDPAMQNVPGRDKALEQFDDRKERMIDGFRRVVRHECVHDRLWKSLTPGERTLHYASGHWKTPATSESLIGRSWTSLGASEEWPKGFSLKARWFDGVSVHLAEFTWDDVEAEAVQPAPYIEFWMRDLYFQHDVFAWRPVSWPPDPFADEEV